VEFGNLLKIAIATSSLHTWNSMTLFQSLQNIYTWFVWLSV